jgi:hypothetical protein
MFGGLYMGPPTPVGFSPKVACAAGVFARAGF